MNHSVKDVVKIRDGNKEDVSIIMSTWLNGLYYGNDWFRAIDKDTYFKKYHDIITSLLLKQNSKVKIACLNIDHEIIVGYSVFREEEKGNILDWIFVRPVWRKQGIAKVLLPSNIIATTHLTKTGRSIKPKDWIFNPFLN